MFVFLQQMINGLAQGGIYSLIAIGWTTVFGIVGVINWTHGEVYMLGAYVGYFVTTFLHLPLIPALLVSMLAGMVISWSFRLNARTHAVLVHEVERLRAGATEAETPESKRIVEDLTGWKWERLWGR